MRRMGELGLDGKEDEKSRVLLAFRANHSQIVKPRAALILKNSLRNTPQGRTFAGSVQGSCLTSILSSAGASQEHVASMASYWPTSAASESL